MKKLIKTLQSKNGELYITTDCKRLLIACCRAEIELYEHSIDIPILGKGKVTRERDAALLLTFEHRPELKTDEAYLQTISRFEFQGDILRSDDVYEPFTFYNCLLDSALDLTEAGSCRFELGCSPETLNKLKTI